MRFCLTTISSKFFSRPSLKIALIIISSISLMTISFITDSSFPPESVSAKDTSDLKLSEIFIQIQPALDLHKEDLFRGQFLRRTSLLTFYSWIPSRRDSSRAYLCPVIVLAFGLQLIVAKAILPERVPVSKYCQPCNPELLYRTQSCKSIFPRANLVGI